MNYQLIAKVKRSIKVLKTPAGVQIWMKDKLFLGASPVCFVCGTHIGEKPFFAPAAGETIPNMTDRIHAACMVKLALLPMIANTLDEEEENRNGK
jgi:hypothetical protein